MIHPIQFLWKQLNGPQITAIVRAIYEYIKLSFDNNLRYFNRYEVLSGTIGHAETVGILSRFSRPLITKYLRQFFFFTYEKNYSPEKGFSSLTERELGGKFSSLDEQQKTVTSLDADAYKRLLNTYLTGNMEIESLSMLDSICNELVRIEGLDNASYSFIWGEAGAGGITVDIGTEGEWREPDVVSAVISSLANTIYYPNPIISVNIAPASLEEYDSYEDIKLPSNTLGSEERGFSTDNMYYADNIIYNERGQAATYNTLLATLLYSGGALQDDWRYIIQNTTGGRDAVNARLTEYMTDVWENSKVAIICLPPESQVRWNCREGENLCAIIRAQEIPKRIFVDISVFLYGAERHVASELSEEDFNLYSTVLSTPEPFISLPINGYFVRIRKPYNYFWSNEESIGRIFYNES